MADAPAQLAFGVKMVAPVIMRFGSSEQQQRFPPRILAAEDRWCQGYSEPGSGSRPGIAENQSRTDAITTVNGQKVWNIADSLSD
ncbi:hypothetical protein [Dokdonella sp.]|uniref:hypothetical protein n=1 Tax=Dokdonella sp. TaxID=2291710 RepID=UPI0035271402